MRALVDMSDAQLEALDRHHCQQIEDGFGLWGKGKLDGLAYQEKLRSEWSARCLTPIFGNSF